MPGAKGGGVILSRGWIEEIDYLRGIAFLGVALQHSLGVFIRYPQASLGDQLTLGLMFNLVKFAVPAFIFISGLVLAHNYGPETDWLSFYRKRAREVALPYLLWTVIYMAYYAATGPAFSVSPGTFLYKLVTGTAGYHLWFIVLIIQFYIVFPLFIPVLVWMKGEKKRVIIVLLLATGLYVLVVGWSYWWAPYLGHSTCSHLLELGVKFRDRCFLLWFFYFLAGAVAGLYLDRWRAIARKVLGGNTILWTALLVVVSCELFAGVQSKVNLNVSTSLKPSMFFYTMSSLVLWYQVAGSFSASPGYAAAFLRTLGRYSTGAYFVHALALSLAVRLLSWIWGGYASAPVFSTVIAFVICVFVSLVFSRAVSSLPGGSWLVGTVK